MYICINSFVLYFTDLYAVSENSSCGLSKTYILVLIVNTKYIPYWGGVLKERGFLGEEGFSGEGAFQGK